MQACLDRAAESLIPPEVDEAKMKQIAKQCAPHLSDLWTRITFCWWEPHMRCQDALIGAHAAQEEGRQ